MIDTWVFSDPHFSHENIIKFDSKERPGEKMRPGFSSIREHDEYLIERINSVVKPHHHYWCGGDFGNPEVARRLNGHGRLILGNHDDKQQKVFAAFAKVRAWRRWNIDGVSFVHTHFPIYMPNSYNSNIDRYEFNIHGHIHEFVIKLPNGQPDPRYLNVAVERLHRYTPLHIDEVVAILKSRQRQMNNEKNNPL